MGACAAVLKSDPDGEVTWYLANSATSLSWQNKPTGFGYKKDKSFRRNAVKNEGFNRNGNQNGELAGKIVFYQSADMETNYGEMEESPTFKFQDGEKLFAKAFFNFPLGKTPIGENNVIPMNEPRAHGSTLLGSRPRVMALFLEVNGKPQTNEHFCQISKSNFDSEIELLQMDPKPKNVEKAMPGSFLTFMSSIDLEPYCFLHLPLVGTLGDVSFKSGLYAETLVRCFCQLLSTLPCGVHKFDVKLQYWYDHCDYNCFVLGDGTNVLGRWYRNIPNSKFQSPHESPEILESPEGCIAKGSFSLELLAPYKMTLLKHMDRRPPPEKYRRPDVEDVRQIAKTVAAGRFCEDFGLCGLPDWVVLTSQMKTRVVSTQESLTGKHKYEAIDFAALWFNEADGRRPLATGTMVEGSMARGEIKLGKVQEDWVWVPSIKNGDVIPTRRRPIKNKYITMAMKSAEKGLWTADWSKLRELYNQGEDEDEQGEMEKKGDKKNEKKK